jgi:hypothetical protein
MKELFGKTRKFGQALTRLRYFPKLDRKLFSMAAITCAPRNGS